MEKMLYIHMGFQKTGTTALQKFLCNNAANLERNNFYYPDLVNGGLYSPHQGRNAANGNGYSLAFYYLEDKSITICPDGGVNLSKLKEVLQKHANVIVSSEWLSIVTDDFLQQLVSIASALDVGVKCIFYVRRADLWVESCYNQRLKMNFEDREFEEFIFNTNYSGRIERFANFFGDESIIVRPFERERFVGQSLDADFLNVLGLVVHEEFIPIERENSSLPAAALNLLRDINGIIRKRTPAHHVLISTLQSLKSDQAVKGLWFSPEERDAYIRKQVRDVKALESRYLPLDSTLFSEYSLDHKDWQDPRKVKFSNAELQKLISKLERQKTVEGMATILEYIKKLN